MMNTKFPALLRASVLSASLLALAPVARAQQAAPDATVEKVLALKDGEFHKGLSGLYLGFAKDPPSLPALWRLMERLEAQRAAQAAPKAGEFSSEQWMDYLGVAGAIGDSGGARDYERLLKIYDSLPFDSRLQPIFFDALSEMWIRRQMAALSKAPLKARVQPSNEPLPEALAGASPPLAEAWRLYRGMAAPFKAEFAPSIQRAEQAGAEKAGAAIEVQQNWPAFYKVIGEFFHGQSQDTVAKMAAFEWGGGCGTGSEQLYVPKNRTLFMALWQQGRHELALGALMAGADRGNYVFRGQKSDWPQRFIAACGLDWEKLYAGAVLDGGWRTQDMAAHGSEQSARLLEQMGVLPLLASRDDYLKAVAAFVAPAPFASGAMPQMVAGLRLTSAPSVAPELQLRLLSILHAQMRPQAGLQTLGTASEMLGELRRPESADVLRRALQLPYSRVRKNALEALQEMGQKVEAPPALEPVGFRVMLDGQPLKDAALDWQMKAGEQQSVSSSAQTDGEGVIRLDRDDLQDTERKITSVVLSSPLLKSPASAWIEASTPVPADLGARTDIALSTQSLTLKIAPGPAAGTQMEVRLKAGRRQPWGVSFEPISEWMPLPKRPTVFGRLQRGRYQIEVRAPGLALWQSEDLTLGEQPVSVEAARNKGADVHFELLAPGGDSRDRSPEYALLRDGKPIEAYRYFDYLSQTYRGLPAGAYTLKIKPSLERQNRGSRATTVT